MRLPIKRTHAFIAILLCATITILSLFNHSNNQTPSISLFDTTGNDVFLLKPDLNLNKVQNKAHKVKVANYYSLNDNEIEDSSEQVNSSLSQDYTDDLLNLLDIDESEISEYDEYTLSDSDDVNNKDIKKHVGHKKQASNRKQIYVTNRIHGFMREVSNCNSSLYNQAEIQKNILCATPDTILSYKSLESHTIERLNNPCFYLRQRNRERGKHGWDFKLTSPHINILDGSKTLNMYRVNCLPGAYLVGFPKCGTTELHARLSEHHQVHGALRKEVSWMNNGKSYEHFFGPTGESTLTLYAYMRMFASAAQIIENNIVEAQTDLLENELKHSESNHVKPVHEKSVKSGHSDNDAILSHSILLDSSPGNFDNLDKIAHMLPNSKLIFIMRDPAEREFSKYRFHFQLSSRRKFSAKNQNPEAFHNYVVKQLNLTTPFKTSTSRYHIYVEQALKYFKRENLLFLVFEEFIENPLDIIERRVLPFLGLDSYDNQTRKRMLKNINAGKHANTSKKSYKMQYRTKVLLMKYFSPYNRRLADTLGDDIWTWGY